MDDNHLPGESPALRHVCAQLVDLELRDSGEGADHYTLRGHASVFNSLSEDLGGFREIIAPGAFRDVLGTNPDVRLLFNHDPSLVLARTASRTLELREDDRGLHVWARCAPTSYAADLRMMMQRGDVDQMSFAFGMRDGVDDWAVTDDGEVVRTILRVGELYDVSAVTYPAYPASRCDMRDVLDFAIRSGRVPGHSVAPADPAGAPDPAAATEPDGAAREARLRELQASTRRRLTLVTCDLPTRPT